MKYKIEVLQSAQLEIEKTFDYYHNISKKLSLKFEEEVASTYAKLSVNPFFQKRYKDFRAIPLLKFPIYYFLPLKKTRSLLNYFLFSHFSKSKKIF